MTTANEIEPKDEEDEKIESDVPKDEEPSLKYPCDLAPEEVDDEESTISSRSLAVLNDCLNSMKMGRKALADVVAIVILAISTCYTIISLYYYSSSIPTISGSYANSLKELLGMVMAVFLILSRYLRPPFSSPLLVRLTQDRGSVTMVISVVGAVCNFVVLLRWYVQEGGVHAWYNTTTTTTSGEQYRLLWQVKSIMCLVLACFVLWFIEFSLMLLTKMGPRYKDLNPDVTASIMRTSGGDRQVVVEPSHGTTTAAVKQDSTGV